MYSSAATTSSALITCPVSLNNDKFILINMLVELGESNSSIFGGNSNWRGPVWFPMNYLLIEALERLDHFYGESLEHEFPNGHETKVFHLVNYHPRLAYAGL